MIKTRLPLYLSIFLLVLTSNCSYAGIEFCPKDVVHCSYVTGLSKDFKDGRYIKLSNAKISLVVCFNYYGLAFIEQENAGRYAGQNTDNYSICSDKQGNNCTLIGSDRFVVSKNGNRYVANPQYFNIDLSKVKDQYPICNALSDQAKNLE